MIDLARGALSIVKEVARLVLRRPVLGVICVALDEAGRVVLMRRAGSGQWCLPGGTVEWGEDLRTALARELVEETGYRMLSAERVIGIYSAPGRDPRMHAVTVVLEAHVAAPRPGDGQVRLNPLEVMEVGTFAVDALPPVLAFDCGRMVEDWRRATATVLA